VSENVEDFPTTPELKDSAQFEAGPQIFAAIKRASQFVANDELRPLMNGVNIMVKNNVMHIAASDSHALYFETFDFEHDDFSVTVPPFDMHEATGTILFDTKNIQIKTVCRLVVIRLHEGVYPIWQNVVPQNNPNKAIFATDEVKQALRICEKIAGESSMLILESNGHSVEVYTQDIDFAQSASTTIFMAMPPVKIAFRLSLFSKCFELFKNKETFEMRYSEPNTAVIFSADGDVKTLLMPIKCD
jgi:DNA polymerase-3 subunit beta